MSLAVNNIPSDWKLKRLKDVANFSNGKGHEKGIDENGEFIVVNSKFISTDTRVKKFSKQNLCPLKKNDITIVMSDIPNGKAIAKCFIVDEDNRYTLNQRIGSITVKEGVNTKFIYYVLNRNRYYLAFDNGVGQTNLRKDEVINCPIQFPPLPEQQKIADILSTVDAKIEVIYQQITKTQDLKKGLMQRLLTKGIGHTEFKDSALGEIPVGWEVVKFRDLISSHCYGPRFSSKDYSETGNVKTIRGTDINKTGDILYNQVPTALLSKDFVDNHKLKDGDLVMITTADCGLTGVYFDQGFPFIPSAYAVRISLNEKGLPLYFKFIFQTSLAKNQVEKFIRKGTVANLPGSDILKFTFALPSIEEQQKIATILGSVDNKLEVLSEKKTTYQELKKGLMQQLLTGKVRVKV